MAGERNFSKLLCEHFELLKVWRTHAGFGSR